MLLKPAPRIGALSPLTKYPFSWSPLTGIAGCWACGLAAGAMATTGRLRETLDILCLTIFNLGLAGAAALPGAWPGLPSLPVAREPHTKFDLSASVLAAGLTGGGLASDGNWDSNWFLGFCGSRFRSGSIRGIP